jgi:hypothetical protein
MRDISREVLDKIKEKGIAPLPKRYFILRRSTVWMLFCFSIILGSIAGSTVIFRVKNAEWDLFYHFKGNLLDYLLITPHISGHLYDLFFCCCLLLFQADTRGYRYRPQQLLPLSLFISVAGAWVVFGRNF